MKPLLEDAENFDAAVARTADRLIAAFGRTADQQAWKIARMPNLTRSERKYCEAVATLVSRRLASVAEPA